MNPEFYSTVATRFGGYDSGAKRTEVFPNGDPEAAFDRVVAELGGAGGQLLDVSCADGRNLLRIAPSFERVLGIDLAPEMLVSAERHRSAAEAENVEFAVGDAAATRLPADHFDVVTSRRGPLHVDEFRRVLKPGGSLVYLGIGEQDARELKEIFGRGQLYRRWEGAPVSWEVRERLVAVGFAVVRDERFGYEEFFHSPAELDVFLQMVPIFEDYDPVVDKESFDRFVAAASSDRGVRLARHWFLIHARKG